MGFSIDHGFREIKLCRSYVISWHSSSDSRWPRPARRNEALFLRPSTGTLWGLKGADLNWNLNHNCLEPHFSVMRRCAHSACCIAFQHDHISQQWWLQKFGRARKSQFEIDVDTFIIIVYPLMCRLGTNPISEFASGTVGKLGKCVEEI